MILCMEINDLKFPVNDVVNHIKEEILALKNPVKSRWLENYVKHNIKSVGVGIPEIREIIQNTEKRYFLSIQPFPIQSKVLDDLMSLDYTEFKLAAILFIQLYSKNINPDLILEKCSSWFDAGLISDWNVCDWLCVRLLTPLIDHYPEATCKELAIWNKDRNLWKARASLVPFAQVRSIENHRQIIYEFSEILINRDERFCKTAVGWVMREFSKYDPAFVTDFLETYQKQITPEVIKNARKYLDRKKIPFA